MSLRMTEEEYAALLERRGPAPGTAAKMPNETAKTPGRAKYGNRKTVLDGMKFDSRHEAQIYSELRYRVLAGELRAVCRQVPFDLPGGIRYMADFVTIAPDMRIEGVYDAKSEATRRDRVYINKRKQMHAIYGIDIREV